MTKEHDKSRMESERKKWEEIYRETDYIVEELRLTLRVGERLLGEENLLTSQNKKGYAFLTAWNPGSRELTAEENKFRNLLLEKNLLKDGYIFYRGKGIPHNGGWSPEKSFLILGISRDDAIKMGQDYGQNAVLYGDAGEKTELLFMSDYQQENR